MSKKAIGIVLVIVALAAATWKFYPTIKEKFFSKK